jgi:hypothetical protein
VDVGKLIVLAVSLAIVGGLMASTVFNNFTNAATCATPAGGCSQNATGILAIVLPFVSVIFGVGILYVAMRELGIGK